MFHTHPLLTLHVAAVRREDTFQHERIKKDALAAEALITNDKSIIARLDVCASLLA